LLLLLTFETYSIDWVEVIYKLTQEKS
jgi:hypothetical protein